MSSEIQGRFDPRVIDNGIGEYQPGDPRTLELIEEEHADPNTNHGVFIGQLNIDLRPDEYDFTLEGAIDSVEFTTDAIGTFDISCSIFCGMGHPYMTFEEALVVK